VTLDAGAWPWLTLVLLGAYHGVNPAMGWLFAVALGFQQRSRAAVLRALLPIALGHEASIALVVVAVSGLQIVARPELVRLIGAVALVLFGVAKLLKPGAHPRWVGLRVSQWDLVVWSLLMSTAHGAGLMLFPVLLGLPAGPTDDPFERGLLPDVAAVLLHTLAMLAAMAVVALLVYEKVGVGVLRRAWLNLDLVWAVVVVGAGLMTLFT
jgi:hypothetical protein